ncbi:MAG: hypothetical protein E7415_03710 [Ruminococcaceae bacterium]|nr:hypothetical protein [Oscillospiraceae bacterium]
MRYYGTSNNQNNFSNPEILEKPAVNAVPQPAQNPPQPTPDRTFNRPESTSGLYGGQAAQNVTSVREWIDEQPPVIFPPRPEDLQRPTIYEYPASNQPSHQKPSNPNQSCQLKTDFPTHLCGHIGDYAYVALSDGMEKRGTVESVGKDFITLSDSGNHIMCPISAISSINVLKSMG